MLRLLWLIPALPFAGALVLALFGRGLSRRTVAIAGVGSIGLSAAISLALVPAFLGRWNALHPGAVDLDQCRRIPPGDRVLSRSDIAAHGRGGDLRRAFSFISTRPNSWRRTKATAGSSRT